MSYPASDIAKLFLSKSVTDNSGISPLKLQKLIYCAAGFYAGATKKNLIDERIECWDYGPVIKEVYFEYKRFRNNIITSSEDNAVKPMDFTDDPIAKAAIDFTWKSFKDTDPIVLANWTHIDGSPWKQAREQGLDHITIELLHSYFKQFYKPQSQPQNG